MNLLSPPLILPQAERTIFLAGPIQGTHDWQAEAIEYISVLAPEIAIASPRRDYMDAEFVYANQVNWETKHLERAGFAGAILFWLAKERDHNCDRSYAQTTRFELAEWITRHQLQGAKICVGIEPDYSGARYVRHRLASLPGIPLCESLEETCQAVVGLASRSVPVKA